jgi:hypothetical protein
MALKEMNLPMTAYVTFYRNNVPKSDLEPIVDVYRNNIQIVNNADVSELDSGRYFYKLPAEEVNAAGSYEFKFVANGPTDVDTLWVGHDVGPVETISGHVDAGVQSLSFILFDTTVLNDGTQSGGTNVNLNVKDGTTWDIDSAAGQIDVEISMDLTNFYLNELHLTAGLTSHPNDYCDILAFNGSTWDTVSTQGTRINPNLGLLNILIPLGSAYVYNDLFRIRIVGSMRSASTLSIDYVAALASTTGDYVLTASEVADATARKMVAAIYPRVSLNTVNGTDPPTAVIGETGTTLYPAKTVAYAVNNLVDPLGYVNIRVSKNSDITLTENLIDQALFNDHAFPGSFWKLQLAGFDISDSFFLGAEVSGAYTFTNPASFRNCKILDITGPGPSMAECILGGRVTITSGDAIFKNCSSSVIDNIAIMDLQDSTSSIYILSMEGSLTLVGMAAGNDVQISGGGGTVILDATCTGGQLTLDGGWQVTDNSGNVTVLDDSNYDRPTHISEQTADINALETDDPRLDNLDTTVSSRASDADMTALLTDIADGIQVDASSISAIGQEVLVKSIAGLESTADPLSVAAMILGMFRARVDSGQGKIVIYESNGLTEWLQLDADFSATAEAIIGTGGV